MKQAIDQPLHVGVTDGEYVEGDLQHVTRVQLVQAHSQQAWRADVRDLE
jgi:hypothetical protein